MFQGVCVMGDARFHLRLAVETVWDDSAEDVQESVLEERDHRSRGT